MAPSKVFLTEDSPTQFELIRRYLEGVGFEVTGTDEGEEALEEIREEKPDVVILDIGLPGIDGYEVCRRLKLDPETQHVPVVFFAQAPKEEAEEKVRKLGAAAYLSKREFDLGDLAKICQRLSGGEATERRGDT